MGTVTLGNHGVRYARDSNVWDEQHSRLQLHREEHQKQVWRTNQNCRLCGHQAVRLAGATGGISTAVNTATRGITGVASMFGIGKGPTDLVQWGEDQVIHYIGC